MRVDLAARADGLYQPAAEPELFDQRRGYLGERGRHDDGAVRLRRRVEPAPGAPASGGRHREIERSRVEMMRRYAELTDCRRRFLLRYFGEVSEEPCGRCDNCAAGRSTPAEAEDAAYAPGRRVEHRQWGRGTLLGAKEGRLTVVFDQVGYKELLEDTVTEGDLLHLA